MPISIDPPRLGDHRHRIWLRIANSDPIAGWLIPSLSAAIPGERNLILIDAPMEALPERYHAEYRTFGARLTALSPSKFTAAKMAVAEVRAGLWPRDQYRVAVHKMGPVPALRLSGDPVTAWHWPGRTFEIVVFPTGGATYEAANTTAALFECLTALNVTEVLRVYLEDIFEHLKDMSDRLNATQCVDRIKGIREIIGQSIKTKLHALTPSRQSWQDFKRRPDSDEFEIRVGRWFDQNHAVVARYLYLCCVANWCTNQFFRLFGITLPETRVELRGESYVADTCISQFCALYGLDSDEIESGLITAIDEVFSQRDNLTGLKTLKPGWPIAEKLRDYLLFLALVENEGRRVFGSGGPNANAAVIFVSRRHASPYGDLAAAVIDSELVELADSRTRSATFYGAGGDPFRPALKAQMWLADSIWSVIPEQDVEVGEDLTWIYLEAEHATVSGKPSFCIARNMKDLEDAMPRLRAVTKPMLADNVRKARDQIREDTLDRIERQITIISPDRETLEDLIHDPLRRVLEESSRERRRTLLRAILRLFEPDDRAVFRVAF